MYAARCARLLLVPLLLTAVACGDDGEEAADGPGRDDVDVEDVADDPAGDPARDDYIDALVATFDQDALPLDDDEVHCIAGAVIDALDTAQLARAGVTPEDLGDAEDIRDLGVDIDDDLGADLVAGFTACDLDLGGALARQISDQLDVALSAGAIGCISDRLSEADGLVEMMAALVLGEDGGAEVDGFEMGVDAMAGCPEVITELFVIGLEGEGLVVDAEAQACIGEEVAARGDELAADMADPDSDGALAEEVILRCQHLLGA